MDGTSRGELNAERGGLGAAAPPTGRPGGLPAQHLLRAPPPWLVGRALGKVHGRGGGAGSCSSSWAWRGASAQCLLRVEPDTLWNGLRLVGDAPGAAAAPAMKLHSPGACDVRPPRAREGGHELLRACVSVEEGRADTRDVIRQQIVSRVRGWAASQKNGSGRGAGHRNGAGGQCFTVLTIGVLTEEATSEQT